jgi:hypothetical protein
LLANVCSEIASNLDIVAMFSTELNERAREALTLLLMPSKATGGHPTPAIETFHQLEIYPGSKKVHFRELHKKTGLPYSEMVRIIHGLAIFRKPIYHLTLAVLR